MKAVILAGGSGTRLRPLTYDCPKPMVPVQDRPFIEYLMSFLKKQGITEIVLCLHYMADRFIRHFGDGARFGLRITYSVEKKPLGTAGAIKNAENLLDERFSVLNGDTFVNLPIDEMLRFHLSNKALATIALTRAKNADRYGVVSVSDDWRVTGFTEKVQVNEGYINVGAYFFDKRILDHIPSDKNLSLEKDILPELVGKKRIFGFVTNGYFHDIGTPEDYRHFQGEVAQGILG